MKATGAPSAATLDPAVISRLPQFVAADKQIAARWHALTDQLSRERRTRHLSAKQLQARWASMEKPLNALRIRLLKPLNQQVAGAVAAAARDRRVSTVLDKRVVGVGLPDITSDVVRNFQKHQSASSAPSSGADIGYIDEAQIRSQPAFRDAAKRLAAYYGERARSLGKRMRGQNATQRAQAERQMAADLRTKRQELYGPLEDRLRAAMDAVMSHDGLSLVMDRRDVIWGGRSVTPQIVQQMQASAAPGAELGRE